MLSTVFTVVRYRPDSLRDEYRNIGVVAWGQDDWAQRFDPDLPPPLAHDAANLARILQHDIAALTSEERVNVAWVTRLLQRYDGPYSTLVFRCDPGSSTIASAAETLSSVYPIFVGQRPSSAYGDWAWQRGGSCDR